MIDYNLLKAVWGNCFFVFNMLYIKYLTLQI
ncbi:MAG: hypothetical protein JWQ57_2736 [Mucilaginibacter sp.]|nr:hypothetical protein [Mucilaginibacter sp.]